MFSTELGELGNIDSNEVPRALEPTHLVPCYLSRTSLKQLDSEFLLGLPYGLAESGLGDMQSFGRRAEVHLLGKSRDLAKVPA